MTAAPIWAVSYPQGVSPDLTLGEDETFLSAVEDSMERYADRVAVRCLGTDMTYARLDAESRAMATGLQALGLAPGARVALMMPSLPQYLVALIGVLRAGFVATSVNPLYPPRELHHQLVDSGAEAIILLEQFAAGFESIRAGTPVRHVILTRSGMCSGG